MGKVVKKGMLIAPLSCNNNMGKRESERFRSQDGQETRRAFLLRVQYGLAWRQIFRKIRISVRKSQVLEDRSMFLSGRQDKLTSEHGSTY